MKVCWTGGIGDVLIIDSYLSKKEKNSIKKMYWATPESKPLISLYKVMYPKIEHFEMWTDWRVRPWFGPAAEVWRAIGGMPEPDILDFSISLWHPKILAGQTYHGSSLMNKELGDISKFNLPEKYIFLHINPANREKSHTRRFTDSDWVGLKKIKDMTNLPIVLIGIDNDFIPRFIPDIIDLRGKTTLAEAFELLKRAEMFAGLASCFSVMAPKVGMTSNKMKIKVNDAIWNQRSLLFSPLTDFSCLIKE